jgi:hypothetical protein
MSAAVIARHRLMVGKTPASEIFAEAARRSLDKIRHYVLLMFRSTRPELMETKATGREDSCCLTYRAISLLGETP